MPHDGSIQHRLDDSTRRIELMATLVSTLTPTMADASGTGATVDLRYITADEAKLGLFLATTADVALIANRSAGANIPGYTGAATDQINSLGRDVFTAGSTTATATDSAIARDYFQHDGAVTSALECGDLDFAETNGDVTWAIVIDPQTSATNEFIMGCLTDDSGQRAVIYKDTSNRIRFNNKQSDSPSGTQDELRTSAGTALATNTKQIVWVSYRDSDRSAAIGIGSSGTADVTATWTNDLMRGSTGLQIGASDSNASFVFSGAFYAAYRFPKFYSEIVDAAGSAVFATELALIDDIYL